MTNDTPPVATIEGDYTLLPTKLAEALTALIPLADAVLDHADSHCRAFPIATAPNDGWIDVWCSKTEMWSPVFQYPSCVLRDTATHWRPLPPPPSTPPLPAVFVELGQALEAIKNV